MFAPEIGFHKPKYLSRGGENMWETPVVEVSTVDTDIELAVSHAIPCTVEVPFNYQVACDHISCC